MKCLKKWLEIKLPIGYNNNYGVKWFFETPLAGNDAIGLHELVFQAKYKQQVFSEYRWDVINEELSGLNENRFSLKKSVEFLLDNKYESLKLMLKEFSKELMQLLREPLKIRAIVRVYDHVSGKKLIEDITEDMYNSVKHDVECYICNQYIIDAYYKNQEKLICLFCAQDRVSEFEHFNKTFTGPNTIKCSNCLKVLQFNRFCCLECKNYNLCFLCDQKGVHSEHKMINIQESRIDLGAVKKAEWEINRADLSNEIFEFIKILKNYVTENNQHELKNIQLQLKEEILDKIYKVDENFEANNAKKCGDQLVILVNEIEKIIMDEVWKNIQKFEALKTSIEIFFENIKRIFDLIVSSITALIYSDDVIFIRGIEQYNLGKSDIYQRKARPKFLEKSLQTFLYNAESNRRKGIRTKFRLKSQRYFSIKWKDSEEQNVANLKHLNAASKKSMKKEFYRLLKSWMDESDKGEYVRYPTRSKLQEMKKAIASSVLVGAIPSTARISQQKLWISKYCLADDDDYRKNNERLKPLVVKEKKKSWRAF
uniref:ZZ-type domain-containing protein n=1 Tax=Acrobeloides nanus TaxID=290746 RepID=A0A914DAC3_9BILA